MAYMVSYMVCLQTAETAINRARDTCNFFNFVRFSHSGYHRISNILNFSEDLRLSVCLSVTNFGAAYLVLMTFPKLNSSCFSNL